MFLCFITLIIVTSIYEVLFFGVNNSKTKAEELPYLRQLLFLDVLSLLSTFCIVTSVISIREMVAVTISEQILTVSVREIIAVTERIVSVKRIEPV